MPSRPARPAATHTSLDTILSRSHCAWWGVISFAMKARTMSRNALCSSVKICRRIALDLPWHRNPAFFEAIVKEILRNLCFTYGWRAGDAEEPSRTHRPEDDARAGPSGADRDLDAPGPARFGDRDRVRGDRRALPLGVQLPPEDAGPVRPGRGRPGERRGRAGTSVAGA